jgi:thioredoxin-related protein
MRSLSIAVFVLMLTICCSERKSEEVVAIETIFNEQLHLAEEKRPNEVFYFLNSKSCSTCIQMNIDFLSDNAVVPDINLVLIGESGFNSYSNYRKLLEGNKTIMFMKEHIVSQYKIRTLDPLLVIFNENGEILSYQNLKETDAYYIEHIIEESKNGTL